MTGAYSATMTGDEMLVAYREGHKPYQIAVMANCSRANVYQALRKRGIKVTRRGRRSIIDTRADALAIEISEDLAGSKETMTVSELVEWLGSEREDIMAALVVLLQRDGLAVSHRVQGALVGGGSLL